jgi:hypothetical protein
MSSALEKLKDALFIDTAGGRDLTRIGQNFGIARPKYSPNDDGMYSAIIPKCGLGEKIIKKRIYEFLEVILGNKYKTFEDGTTTSVASTPLPTLEDTTKAWVPSSLIGNYAIDSDGNYWIIRDNTFQDLTLKYAFPSTESPDPTQPSPGEYKLAYRQPEWDAFEYFPGQITIMHKGLPVSSTSQGATYFQFPLSTDQFVSQSVATTDLLPMGVAYPIMDQAAPPLVADFSGTIEVGATLTQHHGRALATTITSVFHSTTNLDVSVAESLTFPDTSLDGTFGGAPKNYEIKVTHATTGVSYVFGVAQLNKATGRFVIEHPGGLPVDMPTGSAVELLVRSSSTTMTLKAQSSVVVAGPAHDYTFYPTPAHFYTASNDDLFPTGFNSTLAAQYTVEAAPADTYLGDYFVGTPTSTTTTGPTTAGVTDFVTVTSVATFPSEGFFTFSDGVNHEELYCIKSTVLGVDRLTIQQVLSPEPPQIAPLGTPYKIIPYTFQNSFLAGSTVTYVNILASVNEPSSLTVNGNSPVILTDGSGTKTTHIKQFFDLVKAAGVDVEFVPI